MLAHMSCAGTSQPQSDCIVVIASMKTIGSDGAAMISCSEEMGLLGSAPFAVRRVNGVQVAGRGYDLRASHA